MSRIPPKYFHYFLASLLLDCICLFIALYWLGNVMIGEMLLLWIMANILYYPGIMIRRYSSLSKTLLLSLQQLFVFSLLFFLSRPFLGFVDYGSKFPELPLISIFIFISRTLFVFLIRIYRILGFGYNRFVTIGDSEVMQELSDRMVARWDSGNVLEFQYVQVDDLEELETLINSRQINEIYCSSLAIDHERLARLMNVSFRSGVHLYVVSDLQEKEASELPALVSWEKRMEIYPLLDKWNLFIKRLFDLFISAVVILCLLSWFIPLLGLIIILDSKGPIFFIQPRAGKNGRYFPCLKLRSMRPSKEEHQASRDDHRITKVGRFIRNTSIDELPQFINVFWGHMSIVGPRPHIKALNDRFDAEVNLYNDRLLVKPGITGLSQISGLRGETADNKSMHNRVRMDLMYMKNWSIGLDIRIILKTLTKTLFVSDRNAY